MYIMIYIILHVVGIYSRWAVEQGQTRRDTPRTYNYYKSDLLHLN